MIKAQANPLVRSLAAAVLATALNAWAQPACVPPHGLHPAPGTAQQFSALADWYATHGERQCAAETFHRGLAAEPRSAPLHYDFGMFQLAQHNATGAEQEMQRAIAADPHFDRAYLALGVLAHERGDHDGALRAWEQAAQLAPGSVLAIDWIAKARIEAKQYTEALDLLQTAPESEDLAVDGLVAASKASLQERGIATAQRELAAHADWQQLRIALATVLVQGNRFQDAIGLLQTALKVQPDSVELQVLQLRVLLLMGDTDAAEPYASALLQLHPEMFDALYLNGLLKRQTGEFAAALPLLQRAAALEPNHYDVSFNLGVVYARLHRMAEAKTALEHAAQLPGASAEVHFQLASVWRSLGDATAAEAEMLQYRKELAARARHDELVSLSAQAAAKLQTGDAPGAANAERTLLGKFPEEPVHWYNLALALDRTGDVRGERTALEHAVLLRPEFAMAWNQLGYLRARAGEATGAEAAFRQAIASAPEYAEAQNNLGSLLAETGKDHEAEPYFRAALAANPRLVQGWINLAAALAAEGRYTQARQAAQSALEVQPGNGDAQQLLQMLASAPPEGVRR